VRWTKGQRGGREGSWTNALTFHDLVDDDGHCLGWVREDARHDPPIYMATLSMGSQRFPAMPTLEEAKAQLIHHFVVQRLDES